MVRMQTKTMESYRFEVVSRTLSKGENTMSEDPVSLMSGGGSLSIPGSDMLYNENEFGVVQSPHQGSYMIDHSRQNSLMEPWEKSNIKPIEIFATIHNLPEVPDVTVTEPPSKEAPTLPISSQMALPKMMQIDEYNEEMFQLDDEDDDLGPEPLSLSALRTRKMSKSTEYLTSSRDGDGDSTLEESNSYKQLQKFRSDSNLHSGESNMSLVQRVTMLNLTASNKNFKSSSTPPLQRENSEEHLNDGENRLRRWFMKKAVNMSSREMNAIAPFSS